MDEDIRDILTEMEKTIQYRLRMTEIIPVEMTLHRIGMVYLQIRHQLCLNDCTGGGRVYFTVPKLFETSVCLAGAQPSDGWFFVHVEFLFGIGGDLTGLQGMVSSCCGFNLLNNHQSFLVFQRELLNVISLMRRMHVWPLTFPFRQE